MTQFTPKGDFDIHALRDTQAHERIGGQIGDLVHDSSRDSERLAILHDKVIVHDEKIARIERFQSR